MKQDEPQPGMSWPGTEAETGDVIVWLQASTLAVHAINLVKQQQRTPR